MKGTRTLAWHGHRLAYTEAGSGPPLLLLHGWAASSRFWEAAVRHLAPAFRCIALDWLGYGDSDRPGKPVGFDGHAEAVGTVLREFAIEGATVVGHSMGGTLAARAAAAGAPIGRLVLVAPMVRAADGLNRRSRRLLWPGVRHLFRPLISLRPCARWIAANSTLAMPIPELFITGAMEADRTVLMDDAVALGKVDLTALLPSLRQPTLLITGRNDAVLRPAPLEVALRLLPGAELVRLDRCGHCPPLEQPARFAELVARFAGGGGATNERTAGLPPTR
ncbi:MAG: hypothetical protein COZ96_11480 [Nitrospirae bacterium CG_4_8_14_3_um_filter_70_85]|nr:alpha/beta hydrolase [Deltaproteobacteria bacterium]PIW81906.1 MAG: hypothetical protein COZ96_11480 [Nitrospirae bacterium CG_4_8_14_3_um_filter_70_85]PJB95434.1 MAG: hypothetical protein CO080_07755 [Nitrospirae bacterium CG_4_9_14_0_8_um_filter_70_14]